MTRMNPRVDAFLKRAKQWQPEFKKLRGIVLDSGLTEELKWGVPCYTFEDRNVVLMHRFKEYCALLFVKGALLKGHSCGSRVPRARDCLFCLSCAYRVLNTERIQGASHAVPL